MSQDNVTFSPMLLQVTKFILFSFFVSIDYIFLIHSSFDFYLVWLCVLPLVHNNRENTNTLAFQPTDCLSFGHISRQRTSGTSGGSIFSFFRDCRTISLVVTLAIPPMLCRDPLSPPSLSTWFLLLAAAVLTDVWLIVVAICTFLMPWCWLIWELSVQVLSFLYHWFFYFLLLLGWDPYIFCILTPYQMYHLHVFSWAYKLILHSIIFFFVMQKFFSFVVSFAHFYFGWLCFGE